MKSNFAVLILIIASSICTSASASDEGEAILASNLSQIKPNFIREENYLISGGLPDGLNSVIGEIIKTKSPHPPDWRDSSDREVYIFHQLARTLAFQGLFLGMSPAEIARFRNNPHGVEFRSLELLYSRRISAPLRGVGIFTTLQLLKATTNKSVHNICYFGPKTSLLVDEAITELRKKLAEEQAYISHDRPLSDLGSSELVSVLRAAQIFQFKDLAKWRESDILALPNMTLRLAGELHALLKQLSCENMLLR